MERDIGKLEKGVENLEKSMEIVQRNQADQYREMMTALATMHEKFDNFTTSNTKDLVSMRLRFQRLSMTVSAIVAVSAIILKGVFDATRDALAQAWIGH